MVVEKLLKLPIKKISKSRINKIANFLCVDSGSHDYPIMRAEGIELGLPIIKPSFELNKYIETLHNMIVDDMQLRSNFNDILGNDVTSKYTITRVIIESDFWGTEEFNTKGILKLLDNAGNQVSVNENGEHSAIGASINSSIVFEGWEKVENKQ